MKWRFIGKKYPRYATAYLIFAIGIFLHIMGLFILSVTASYALGLWLLISGIVMTLIVVVFSFKFYIRPYLNANVSLWCFQFLIIYILVGFKLLYNTDISQQVTSDFEGPAVDFPILKLIFLITVIIFVTFAVIEAIASVLLLKKYGKEWPYTILDKQNIPNKDWPYPIEDLEKKPNKPIVQKNRAKSINCLYCNRSYSVSYKLRFTTCPNCDSDLIECKYCSTLFGEDKIRCPSCHRFDKYCMIEISYEIIIYMGYGILIWFMLLTDDIFSLFTGVWMLFVYGLFLTFESRLMGILHSLK